MGSLLNDSRGSIGSLYFVFDNLFNNSFSPLISLSVAEFPLSLLRTDSCPSSIFNLNFPN